VGEVIFSADQDIEKARAFRNELRSAAADFGRNPDEIVVLPGLSTVLGSTEAEARQRRELLDELLPDAYVRVIQADQTTRHYFVEIYGTGRSTYAQTKRLVSYVAYAESGEWGHSIGTLNPSLLILTASAASQARLRAQLQYLLQDCFADDFCIFTTSKGQLAADNNRDIWHEVHHRKV